MKKLFLTLALCLFAFSAAATTLNSVRDERGNPVRDSAGTCVRHDWEENNDVCAPPPPPAPEPVVEAPKPEPEPAPAPVLTPAKQLKAEDRTVYFEFDKYDLTDAAKTKLDSIAEILKADAEVQSASIVGFADKMGKDKYNLTLSENRATAVKNYLAEKGYVKTDLAKTEWVGSAKSSANCAKTKKRKAKIECYADDRKVEVKINFLQ